jgi:hypothetical protein
VAFPAPATLESSDFKSFLSSHGWSPINESAEGTLLAAARVASRESAAESLHPSHSDVTLMQPIPPVPSAFDSCSSSVLALVTLLSAGHGLPCS